MKALMPGRYIGLMFQIDTNRINSRQKLESMNKLEQWHKDGVIVLDMPEPATKEILAEADKQRVQKATGYSHSYTFADTPDEKTRVAQIAKVLFPNGIRMDKDRNDVEIVFNAGKYRRILITNDGGSNTQPGGILGNASSLKEKFGIQVMRDSEAVKLVQQKITERDNFAKAIAKKYDLLPPEWVGKD